MSAVGGTLPFVRHRQVGASLSGLIAGGDSQSRVGPVAFSDVAGAPLNVHVRVAAVGLVCDAMPPFSERRGDGQRKSTRKSRLGLCVVTCGPS